MGRRYVFGMFFLLAYRRQGPVVFTDPVGFLPPLGLKISLTFGDELRGRKTRVESPPIMGNSGTTDPLRSGKQSLDSHPFLVQRLQDESTGGFAMKQDESEIICDQRSCHIGNLSI